MFFLAPFIAWVTSGCIKFIINYIKYGRNAKKHIGNGGFPSTHTTILATTTFLIGLNEGYLSPLFGLAVAVSFITIIDALGIRRALGSHAEFLNELSSHWDLGINRNKFREKQGHNGFEVVGGIILGFVLAYIILFLSSLEILKSNI